MSFFPRIKGPVALFNNLPIAPQNYAPSQFAITAITYGITTIVTMANGTNNVVPNYVIGQEVRLNIPEKYSAQQLNGKTGFVLSLPTTNSVEVGINSIGADPFVSNPTFLPNQSQTLPQIVAIGDVANGQTNSTGRTSQSTFIPGSFINVSP